MTLEVLKSKWWYRLVKVLYSSFFILVTLIGIGTVFSQYRPRFDPTRTYVTCDNGKKVYPKDYDILLFSAYVDLDDTATLNSACRPAEPTPAVEYGPPDERGFRPLLVQPNANERARWTEEEFTVVPVYKERDWGNSLGYSALVIVCAFLVFEGIRRIFYYVAIGTWLPERKK